MAIKPHQLVMLALAGTVAFLVASQFSTAGRDTEIVEATRTSNAVAAATPAPAAADADSATPTPQASQRMSASSAGDAFRPASWTPPPAPPPAAPPPAPAPPPPPPSAPPLPFSFVGLLEQKAARPTAFLAKGEALVIAGVGDVIDGTYRVESLSPAGLVVTYLPLNQKQSLAPTGGTP